MLLLTPPPNHQAPRAQTLRPAHSAAGAGAGRRAHPQPPARCHPVGAERHRRRGGEDDANGPLDSVAGHYGGGAEA